MFSKVSGKNNNILCSTTLKPVNANFTLSKYFLSNQVTKLKKNPNIQYQFQNSIENHNSSSDLKRFLYRQTHVFCFGICTEGNLTGNVQLNTPNL